MIKLYKEQDGIVHYYEAWDNKNNGIVVHCGKLGHVGENKTVPIPKGKTAESVIKEELRIPRSQGYKEINPDQHKTLVIQYKIETSRGREKDLEKRYKVEDLLNEFLGWTGNGHCDGGQIGSGSMEVFAYVIDPYIACKRLVDKLEEKALLSGAVNASEGDDGEFIVLYPIDF